MFCLELAIPVSITQFVFNQHSFAWNQGISSSPSTVLWIQSTHHKSIPKHPPQIYEIYSRPDVIIFQTLPLLGMRFWSHTNLYSVFISTCCTRMCQGFAKLSCFLLEQNLWPGMKKTTEGMKFLHTLMTRAYWKRLGDHCNPLLQY